MGVESIIGKCGLYCGACTIYRAQRDSEEWRNRIADSFKCSPENVKCNGCGDLTSECWGDGCKIVLCTRAKGYSHCHECPEYENRICDHFERISKRYAECGVDLRNNLALIKDGKIDEWFVKSRDQFTCKACGRPIAAGSEKCHHCGTNI